ncbi:iron complex transport system permease protein [Evansella caseinilytica]|uniref:Probable heme-iron transport system permease protein IsdF n=1 Tax=Evansella caseinilytica TaxID=1503961 RepID=A0A1H3REL9_9BACI|nr:iron ABC transporter permease [Evansella caseinilytica]SDZ23775.1 iron complex transport system permease protein [Evansella caseinilytica]
MRRTVISFIIVITLLLAVTVYSAITGSLEVSVSELIRGLVTGDNEKVEIIKDLRLPRIIISLFVGACLAVSGVLLQAVMRNPLAEAGIIGISSGANFISILVLSFFPHLFFWSPLLAFLGGVFACFIVYAFSWKSGLQPLRLVLIGVAVNAIFSGLNESFNYRGSYAVTSITQATTSTLSMKTWSDVDVMVIYGTIGLILSFFLFSWCDLLVLQDKTMQNLGFRVQRARIIVSVVAVHLAAVSTAIAGVIAFVGLLIPHTARILVGTDHKVLIPFSALSGALLIILADTIGRTLVAPNEIPASIIMAIIGGPFLIFLVRKSGGIYGS